MMVILASSLSIAATVVAMKAWDGKHSTTTLPVDQAIEIIEHPNDHPGHIVRAADSRARIVAARIIVANQRLKVFEGDDQDRTRQSAVDNSTWLRKVFEDK
jgi:hypothetical protein